MQERTGAFRERPQGILGRSNQPVFQLVASRKSLVCVLGFGPPNPQALLGSQKEINASACILKARDVQRRQGHLYRGQAAEGFRALVEAAEGPSISVGSEWKPGCLYRSVQRRLAALVPSQGSGRAFCLLY